MTEKFRARIAEPKPGQGKVSVSPGTVVSLLGEPKDDQTAHWQRPDNQPLPVGVQQSGNELRFVMDTAGYHAGEYCYGTDADKSDPVTVKLKKLRASLQQLLHSISGRLIASLVAYGIIVGLIFFVWPKWFTLRSYIFAGATLIIALLILSVTGNTANTQSGLAWLVKGADQRVSTSKSQYLLWTFGLLFALSYIGAYSIITGKNGIACTSAPGSNCVPTQNWEAYLVLLGVPAGAAVAAKGIVSYKVQNGIVQKTQGDTASPADVVTNDDGQVDLIDSQYLVFNVLAFVYVMVIFFKTGTLPAVPDLLLGLTSTAAGTYVLNKSVQTNKPVITAVNPSLITSGTKINIRGQNLFPPGSADDATVKVGGLAITGSKRSKDNSVDATVPDGMSSSDADQNVTVITDAHIETEPYPVTIVGLQVIGWKDRPPTPGQQAEILVQGLLGVPDQHVWVKFDSTTLQGLSQSDGSITVEVPPYLSDTPVKVAVGSSGRWSPPEELNLNVPPK